MRNQQLDHHHHSSSTDKYPICLLAHDLTSPANVGSLFRMADALGIAEIILSGCSPVPPNNKISRTSRSTDKHVTFTTASDPVDVVRRLRAEGYTIISLEKTSDSIDLNDIALSIDDRICLIVGAENSGVCQSLLDSSDMTIHIAMAGNNSSMNVAMACSIAVYEIIHRFLVE